MSSSRSYQVDVIAGDGIGQEVMPAAVRCVDAIAEAAISDQLAGSGVGIGLLPRPRPDVPTDGIDQLADRRRHPARGGRRARHRRRRDSVGAADSDPPGVLAVRESATGPDPARGDSRRWQRGQPRHGHRPGERRGGVLRGRRPVVSGAAGGDGRPGSGVHPYRSDPGRGVRGRPGEGAARPAHLGHQVQRHHPHHAVLGRGGAEVVEGPPGKSPWTRCWSTLSRPGWC